MPSKTVILGSEYDQELQLRLLNVLNSLSVEVRSNEWFLGGSQELQEIHLKVLDYDLLVELETFIGLSITGEERIINLIVDKLGK